MNLTYVVVAGVVIIGGILCYMTMFRQTETETETEVEASEMESDVLILDTVDPADPAAVEEVLQGDISPVIVETQPELK